MSAQKIYILVEGTPESPELAFLTRTINDIFQGNNKPYIAEVFEVGGCNALKNGDLAKAFYKLSKDKAHEKVPVLAIADSDYRVEKDKKQLENSQIIKSEKAKILYWSKHEWENYLLVETQVIADFVNEFPTQPKKNGGFCNKTGVQLTKNELDEYLQDYFISKVREEFFECLKFNLSPKVDWESIRISEPDTFKTDSFELIRNWFFNYFHNKTAKIQKNRETLYEEIKNQYGWDGLIANPESLLIDVAKDHFRGKEALSCLIDFIDKKIGCNIAKKEFQIELLKQMNNDSAIVKDLEKLLLKELP